MALNEDILRGALFTRCGIWSYDHRQARRAKGSSSDQSPGQGTGCRGRCPVHVGIGDPSSPLLSSLSEALWRFPHSGRPLGT